MLERTLLKGCMNPSVGLDCRHPQHEWSQVDNQNSEKRVMKNFELAGREFVELNHLLKLTGLCSSGGAAKRFIAAGAVSVDGQVELRKRCKIRTGQLVEFEGQQITVVSESAAEKP